MTGELKNKIDGLWEIFWTGGITNPLEVVEQMTYLMFIKASANLSSSSLLSDSVGSIIRVPATGKDTVGAWNP